MSPMVRASAVRFPDAVGVKVPQTALVLDLLEVRCPFQIAEMVVHDDTVDVIDRVAAGRARPQKGLRHEDGYPLADLLAVDRHVDQQVPAALLVGHWADYLPHSGTMLGLRVDGAPYAAKARHFVVLRRAGH